MIFTIGMPIKLFQRGKSMSNERRIRTAIIGCGGYPYRFLYECMKALPFQLVAISDECEAMSRFSERYCVSAQYENHCEMILKEKPEFVLVFPQEKDQYRIAVDCVKAGAYVFCERPISRNISEIQELVTLQRKMGCSVIPRLNRRFTPSYIMARSVLNQPEFGKPSMYFAKYHAQPYASEESFIWNHIIHHLDVARYLLGEISILFVDKVLQSETKMGFNILFKSEQGCSGVLQTSSLQRGEYPVERVEITGYERNLMIDNLRYVEYLRPSSTKTIPSDMVLREGEDALVWKPNSAQLNNFSYYGFETCFAHIAECILSKKASEHDISDMINTLKLVEQVAKMI